MAAPVQPALDGTIPEPKIPKARQRAADYETWIAEVRPKFVEAAASGRIFTAFQIADEHQLSEPPDPAHHWGRLLSLLHAEGVIKRAGWACSSRPTAHASGVRKWQGTAAARQGRAA